MSALNAFVGKTVTILTADGRHLTGKLMGCDNTTNIILSSTIERIFSALHSTKPSETVSHGLYIIRGDSVAVCGLVDEDVEREIDWSEVRAAELANMKHP